MCGWRAPDPRLLILLILTVLTSACGGVINPPPIPTRPPPPPPRPTATPEPTPTPEPERWVKNHRVTPMWSGPLGAPGSVSFGTTSSAFCVFRIVEEADNARILVYNPYADGTFWIEADAVGPVADPPHRAGSKPVGVNCTDAVYDGRSIVVPDAPVTRTPQPTSTQPTATAVPTPLADARAGQALVLALYYPWYDLDTWRGGQTADLPVEPYASADATSIARQVGLAREAGIDALVSAWYGPMDANPTETNFNSLLAASERAGLKAALLLETDNDQFYPGRDAMVRALRHFMTVHAVQPAYLRVDGRPVILVWNPTSVYGADGRRVNSKSAAAIDAWTSLLREVDPEHKALWIAEGDYFDLLRVFDGIFPYSVAWSPDPANQLASYGRTVRDRASSFGARKVWAATAMPGYDDTRISGRAGTFAVPRQDGRYYERTFQGAIDSRPDWVVITSFNEWLEGTQIEPASSYGRQYLDLTRTLAERFRTSRH
jgi:hypothetical protein